MEHIENLLSRFKVNGMVDFSRMKAECERVMTEAGMVETKNFGWVLKKDMEEFPFLKRDEGVPMAMTTVWETSDVPGTDKYGNRAKKTTEVAKQKMGIAPEWFAYQNKLKARRAAREFERQAMESFSGDDLQQSLLENFGGKALPVQDEIPF